MTSAPRMTACPSCGAAARPDAPWCTLCHFDLRPAPEPVVPAVSVPAPTVAPDPLTASLLDLVMPLPAAAPQVAPAPAAAPVADLLAPAPAAQPVEAAWPCLRCGASNAMSLSLCCECGQSFLARDSEPLLVLPGVGDVGKLSRGQRIGLALGAVAVVLIPVALITALLTSAPPAHDSTPTQQIPPATAP